MRDAAQPFQALQLLQVYLQLPMVGVEFAFGQEHCISHHKLIILIAGLRPKAAHRLVHVHQHSLVQLPSVGPVRLSRGRFKRDALLAES